jgi:hypothetical protein
MRSVRWMLATGYGCLVLTGAWVLWLRGASAENSWRAIAESISSPAAPGTAPVVVLLLNPRDCAERIEALAAWNTVHASGKARIVGLVSDGAGGLDALPTIRDGAGLAFPLQPVAHRRMVAALGGLNYRSTPVAVVLDPQMRIRIAVPLYDADVAAPVSAVTKALEDIAVTSFRSSPPQPSPPG